MAFGWILWVIGIACAVWVIMDVLTNQKRMQSGAKAAWIVCAVLFSVVTAIVYYFVVKK